MWLCHSESRKVFYIKTLFILPYGTALSLGQKMIITVVIGLIIWFAVPLFFKDKYKKKKNKYKAIKMICQIVGIAIIIVSVVRYIMVLVSTKDII